MNLEIRQVADLVPYENNPRINAAAVKEVKQSIEQCGYITPIVIDEDDVILAGHTRHLALTQMGVEEVECIVINGLDDDQKRKFRLLDNKVGEIATWDIEMLKTELQGLDFGMYEGFAHLIKDDEDEFDDIDVSIDTEIRCPKCGTVVPDED